MKIVENLPTYGIHYYEVKDKSGLPWWLGLSYKGISLYDHNDKRVPRRVSLTLTRDFLHQNKQYIIISVNCFRCQVFAWKQLENLYFRDRKFSIEVHDPKR